MDDYQNQISEGIQNNRGLVIQIVVIIVAIIVLLIILRFTVYRKNSTTIQKANISYNNGGQINIDPPPANVVTYMVWFFIKDWTTFAPKLLFSHGSTCTYAYLDREINTLRVVPQFSPPGSIPANLETISVENIAIQSWNCLTVMQRGRIFDVYMNGKLVRSHVTNQATVPNFPNDTLNFVWGRAGYGSGQVAQNAEDSGNEIQAPVYFARIYIMGELTPQQVYSWYRKGPGTGKGAVEQAGLSPLAKITGTLFPSGHYEWVPDDNSNANTN